MKKTIKLEAIDPIEIYGAGNKILTEFCSYFPNLKVVARGHDLILDGKDESVIRASKNIPTVKDAYVNTINVYDLLANEKFIITEEAVKLVEEVYA